jgi:hypothetical protein
MQTKFSKKLKMVASIELTIAAGIVCFWIAFFSFDLVSMNDPQLETVYSAFESAFPVPDGWLVITLIIAAIGLFRKRSYGFLFSVIAGASLIFLGLLDISFNIQNGIYLLGFQEAIINLFLNILCPAAGFFLILFAWTKRSLWLSIT